MLDMDWPSNAPASTKKPLRFVAQKKRVQTTLGSQCFLFTSRAKLGALLKVFRRGNEGGMKGNRGRNGRKWGEMKGKGGKWGEMGGMGENEGKMTALRDVYSQFYCKMFSRIAKIRSQSRSFAK